MLPRPPPPNILPPPEMHGRRARWRQWKDRLANLAIGGGGLFVIFAIALIFFYLLYEVWPLLQSPRVTPQAAHAMPLTKTAISLDEYGESGLRLSSGGEAEFFRQATGERIGGEHLPLPAGSRVTAIARAATATGTLFGLGLSDGGVLVLHVDDDLQLTPDGQRLVVPRLRYPYGRAALPLAAPGEAVAALALSGNGHELHLLGRRGDALRFQIYGPTHAPAPDFLGLADAVASPVWRLQSDEALPALAESPRFLFIAQEARWAFAVHGENRIAVFDLRAEGGPALQQDLSAGAARITAVALLGGQVSLLLGDATGRISQWFMAREAREHFHLVRVRGFQLGEAPVTAIAAGEQGKGFVAGDRDGRLGYFHTTAERTLAVLLAAEQAVTQLVASPRLDRVLAQTDAGQSLFALDAAHADISWQALGGKVWYESYPAPEHVWQSTSGNAGFESKLSLAPLTFGTLKAAFYAMLLAAPLAICAAMYTATFMAPRLRRTVKPTIELMEALPTVILGFLAGLWLAPLVEAWLPGIFSLLLLTPLCILLSGFLWSCLPREKREFADGWLPLWLLLPVLLTGWLSFALSHPIEQYFFGGDMRQWLRDETGIGFNQRNALVVGLAMGFAVIPTIYAIAEDALHAVPRHLTNASLALGATPWQTLVHVVLPTASPGIFSALMIGLGRAVGETMIVLMATGNTPITDMNIFEGMRTLSANVAVEVGEAEVGSTHFRVLFLSALLLFVLTFVLNTVAEVVRNRLRKKYGSL